MPTCSPTAFECPDPGVSQWLFNLELSDSISDSVSVSVLGVGLGTDSGSDSSSVSEPYSNFNCDSSFDPGSGLATETPRIRLNAVRVLNMILNFRFVRFKTGEK